MRAESGKPIERFSHKKPFLLGRFSNMNHWLKPDSQPLFIKKSATGGAF